jgi:hypothetical protein
MVEVSIAELEIHYDEIIKRSSFIRYDEYACICKKLSERNETYF